MAEDVDVSQCDRCLGRKAPLVNMTTTQPLEMICVDFLSLEPSKGRIENILVVTDHFTQYSQAFPTRNQTAKTTARIIFENYIIHYRFRARIHSDQGRNFESSTIKHLCDLARVKKSHTTPYHPMSDGQAERFNHTLLDMLGTLDPAQKADWKKNVSVLTHSYNATRHESTGYTPFYLMYGRHPRLHVDLFFRRKGASGETDYTEYISTLKKQLSYAYSVASASVAKTQEHQRSHYNRKVRGNGVEVGDRVLVRNVGLKRKHKIADRWHEKVYVVLAQPNQGLSVFEVQQKNSEKGKRRIRVLHRNLLLPINSVPTKVPGDVDEKVEDDEPAHAEDGVEEDPSSESEDDMPSFPVLKPRPVPATRPIPARRISLRRDPPAVAPPPETPPTSPEPIDDRAELSLDEEIDEPDDTDNSLIIVSYPPPLVLVVADDVPDVVPGDVEVVRQQLFPVPDPGQNVAAVQRMNDEGTTAASPPIRRSDRVRRQSDFFNSDTHHISQQTADFARRASLVQGLLALLLPRVKFVFEYLLFNLLLLFHTF